MNVFGRRFSIMAALAVLVGFGCGEVDCPDGATYDGRRCVRVDGGATDAGNDAALIDAEAVDGCDLVTWFADADDDGYGDPATYVEACSAPDGFVANDEDCDDGCGVCHPDAAELCDTLDNDCDTDVDEASADESCGWTCATTGCDDPRQVAAGAAHTCATVTPSTEALAPARVACWGYNFAGQLGDGSRADRTLPVYVSGLDDALEVSTGFSHTCAIRADRDLYCWGHNVLGQLGIGDSSVDYSDVPLMVPGLADVRSIDLLGDRTCATSGFLVYCWGNLQHEPVQVAGVTDANAVAVGNAHACALRATGEVSCWGSNEYGQLGDESSGTRSDAQHVPGLRDVAMVALGNHHSCALREIGELLCWGRNDRGQLGIGNTMDMDVPTSITAFTSVGAIAAGTRHTCAIEDGEVHCWGANDEGQLGDGTTVDSNRPIAVELPARASSIGLGLRHSCAVLEDGTTWCWGENDFGQLGDGTIVASPVPVRVLPPP